MGWPIGRIGQEPVRSTMVARSRRVDVPAIDRLSDGRGSKPERERAQVGGGRSGCAPFQPGSAATSPDAEVLKLGGFDRARVLDHSNPMAPMLSSSMR